mmetsp:Transcript_25251/g.53362  ORF Transcript_25251/g.53362 Transcript_25251/m.53362 type:complete len:233 (+) Transcript_25251:274-972(+)
MGFQGRGRIAIGWLIITVTIVVDAALLLKVQYAIVIGTKARIQLGPRRHRLGTFGTVHVRGGLGIGQCLLQRGRESGIVVPEFGEVGIFQFEILDLFDELFDLDEFPHGIAQEIREVGDVIVVILGGVDGRAGQGAGSAVDGRGVVGGIDFFDNVPCYRGFCGGWAVLLGHAESIFDGVGGIGTGGFAQRRYGLGGCRSINMLWGDGSAWRNVMRRRKCMHGRCGACQYYCS